MEIWMELDYIKSYVKDGHPFEPVEDRPGYYWLNKKNYEIISEETLRKVIEEYEASHKLFLSDT